MARGPGPVRGWDRAGRASQVAGGPDAVGVVLDSEPLMQLWFPAQHPPMHQRRARPGSCNRGVRLGGRGCPVGGDARQFPLDDQHAHRFAGSHLVETRVPSVCIVTSAWCRRTSTGKARAECRPNGSASHPVPVPTITGHRRRIRASALHPWRECAHQSRNNRVLHNGLRPAPTPPAAGGDSDKMRANGEVRLTRPPPRGDEFPDYARAGAGLRTCEPAGAVRDSSWRRLSSSPSARGSWAPTRPQSRPPTHTRPPPRGLPPITHTKDPS